VHSITPQGALGIAVQTDRIFASVELCVFSEAQGDQGISLPQKKAEWTDQSALKCIASQFTGSEGSADERAVRSLVGLSLDRSERIQTYTSVRRPGGRQTAVYLLSRCQRQARYRACQSTESPKQRPKRGHLRHKGASIAPTGIHPKRSM